MLIKLKPQILGRYTQGFFKTLEKFKTQLEGVKTQVESYTTMLVMKKQKQIGSYFDSNAQKIIVQGLRNGVWGKI